MGATVCFYSLNKQQIHNKNNKQTNIQKWMPPCHDVFCFCFYFFGYSPNSIFKHFMKMCVTNSSIPIFFFRQTVIRLQKPILKSFSNGKNKIRFVISTIAMAFLVNSFFCFVFCTFRFRQKFRNGKQHTSGLNM